MKNPYERGDISPYIGPASKQEQIESENLVIVSTGPSCGISVSRYIDHYGHAQVRYKLETESRSGWFISREDALKRIRTHSHEIREPVLTGVP